MPSPLARLWQRLERRARNRLAPGGVVLCYHRIVDPEQDPTGFAVSPEHFAEHLDVIGRLARPRSLAAIAADLRAGRRPARAVAVTIDDGYADGLTVARPLLARQGIPATFFVPGDLVGRRPAYYWDALHALVLEHPALPAALALEVAGRAWRWQAPPGVDARRSLHGELCALLQPLRLHERDAVLADVAAWAGRTGDVATDARVMTADELRGLAAQDGCEIGAHTASHTLLPAHPPAVQMAELADGRRRLEEVIGRAVTAVAYPYGGSTPETRELAAAAGFAVGAGLEPVAVRGGEDPLDIPRYIMRDGDGDDLARLLRWLALG